MKHAALLENATFRKANGSNDVGCVAVAFVERTAGVRDWKADNGPILAFSAGEWNALVATVKAGRLDRA